MQRHHRPIAPPLLDDQEEQDERDRGDTGGDSRAGPPASSRADRQRPYERTDPDSCQRPAESIQGQVFSVLVRRDVAQGQHDGTSRKRQIYKKDEAPAAEVNQPTAENGAHRARSGAGGRPDADRASLRLAGKRLAQQGKAIRQKDCSTDALDRPTGEQRGQVRRKRAAE